MFKYVIYIVFAITLFASCKKDKGLIVSDDVTITPKYSLPLGNYNFDINNYLNGLRNITGNIPDSLLYNNESLPNPALSYYNTYKQDFYLNTISEQYENIKIIKLNLLFINEYPTSFESTLQLNNLEGLPVWSYPDTPLKVEGAIIDNDGEVVKVTKSFHEVELPENIVDNLGSIGSFLFTVEIETRLADVEKVKFYDTQKIKLYLGTKVGLEINN